MRCERTWSSATRSASDKSTRYESEAEAAVEAIAVAGGGDDVPLRERFGLRLRTIRFDGRQTRVTYTFVVVGDSQK